MTSSPVRTSPFGILVSRTISSCLLTPRTCPHAKMVGASSFPEAVAYLSQVRSKDGLSVFDHLAGIVKTVSIPAGEEGQTGCTSDHGERGGTFPRPWTGMGRDM